MGPQNSSDEIPPVSEIERQEEVILQTKPPLRTSFGSRFGRWIFLSFLILGLCSISLFYLLNLHQSFAPMVPPDQTLHPLMSFELSEATFFTEWKEHVFHQKTSYKIESDGNQEKFLHAISSNASSVLFKEVNIKLSERPFLTWEWRVIQFPSHKKNKVLAAKSDNDFAGRVYAVFKGRTPFSSDVIQYVWDDHFPEGTYVTSPYSRSVKVLVAQNGPMASKEEWVLEKRDLVKDYEMLFGKTPRGSLFAIGVMSDSDNTGTVSEAHFRRFLVQKPSI